MDAQSTTIQDTKEDPIICSITTINQTTNLHLSGNNTIISNITPSVTKNEELLSLEIKDQLRLSVSEGIIKFKGSNKDKQRPILRLKHWGNYFTYKNEEEIISTNIRLDPIINLVCDYDIQNNRSRLQTTIITYIDGNQSVMNSELETSSLIFS